MVRALNFQIFVNKCFRTILNAAVNHSNWHIFLEAVMTVTDIQTFFDGLNDPS